MIPVTLASTKEHGKPASNVMVGGNWCIGRVWKLKASWAARAYRIGGNPPAEKRDFDYKRDAVEFVRRNFEFRHSRPDTTAAPQGIVSSPAGGSPSRPFLARRSCGGGGKIRQMEMGI